MENSDIPPMPASGFELPPPRLRRRTRRQSPVSPEESAVLFDALEKKVTPSAGFYSFTVISGIVLAAALVLNSPALSILAILLAPFLSPLLGISLSMLFGSFRLFLRSFAAMLVASGIIFLFGILAGWLSQLTRRTSLYWVITHVTLTVYDIVLISIGVVFTMRHLTHIASAKPLVPNIAIAYILFIPLAAGGFGLTGHIAGLTPQGLFLFCAYFLLAVFLGFLTLASARLHPSMHHGFSRPIAILLVVVVLAALAGSIFYGLGLHRSLLGPTSVPLATTPIVNPTITVTPPRSTTTASPRPSITPTQTQTLTPTPGIFVIRAIESNGVIVRTAPDVNSELLTTLFNGVSVLSLNDASQTTAGTWLHIRLADGRDGWILDKYLVTPTPIP